MEARGLDSGPGCRIIGIGTQKDLHEAEPDHDGSHTS